MGSQFLSGVLWLLRARLVMHGRLWRRLRAFAHGLQRRSSRAAEHRPTLLCFMRLIHAP